MTTDKYRQSLNDRSRFETVTLYCLVALVLAALAVLLKPAGPLIEGPLIAPEPCRDAAVLLGSGWGEHYSVVCSPEASGELVERGSEVWWLCVCPETP